MLERSRRDFLKLTSASLIWAAGGALAGLSSWPAAAGDKITSSAKRELILLCDTETYSPDPRKYITRPGSLNGLDVASGEVFSVSTPFFGHIATQNPTRPEHIITVEKWGQQGAIIDVKEKRILSSFEAAEGNVFFGHSAFNADGSVVVCSEQDRDRTRGQIVARDAASMKVIRTMNSYGISPHECRSSDGGHTLMVANAGSQKSVSNLSWIDFESGKLLHQVEMGKDSEVLFSHFDVAHDGWVCMCGVGRADSLKKSFRLVQFISPEGKVFVPDMPEMVASKMTYEALSVAFLGTSGLVAVTLPLDGMLLIFDYKKKILLHAMAFKGASGLLPRLDMKDGDEGVIVSLNQQKNLVSVTKHGNDHPVVAALASKFGGFGLHLSRVYV